MKDAFGRVYGDAFTGSSATAGGGASGGASGGTSTGTSSTTTNPWDIVTKALEAFDSGADAWTTTAQNKAAKSSGTGMSHRGPTKAQRDAAAAERATAAGAGLQTTETSYVGPALALGGVALVGLIAFLAMRKGKKA